MKTRIAFAFFVAGIATASAVLYLGRVEVKSGEVDHKILEAQRSIVEVARTYYPKAYVVFNESEHYIKVYTNEK